VHKEECFLALYLERNIGSFSGIVPDHFDNKYLALGQPVSITSKSLNLPLVHYFWGKKCPLVSGIHQNNDDS